MADPTRLDHQLDRRTGCCRIVLATPERERARSRRAGCERDGGLGRWLPDDAGFSLDLGYVPATRGPDGLPLDVIVLDARAEPETLTGVRLVGVMHADHTEQGRTLRDDRLIAVGGGSTRFDGVREIGDLGPRVVGLIKRAWTAYNAMRCACFQIVSMSDAAGAFRLVAGEGARRPSPGQRSPFGSTEAMRPLGKGAARTGAQIL